MIVDTKNIEEIKPYWRNPKKNEHMIDDVCKSIKEFGYQSPILTDKNMIIVLGHARYKALMKLKGNLKSRLKELSEEIKNKDLGEEEKEQIISLRKNLIEVNEGRIRVLVSDELSPEKAKEYRITDNQLSNLSEWDEDKLKFEIKELGAVIGFSEEEIRDMIVDEKIDFNDVLAEDMEKEQDKIDGKYKHLINVSVELICPHCMKKFEINKNDLKSKYV